MDLWSEYIEEKYNTKLCKYDNGFFAYKVCPNGEFYVDDIYIRKEERSGHSFAVMCKDIITLAENNKCDRISGSVFLSANNPELPLVVFLKLGFKIITVIDNKLILVKFLDTLKDRE